MGILFVVMPIIGIFWGAAYLMTRATAPSTSDLMLEATTSLSLEHVPETNQYLLVHRCRGQPTRAFDVQQNALLPSDADLTHRQRNWFGPEIRDLMIAALGGISALALPKASEIDEVSRAANRSTRRNARYEAKGLPGLATKLLSAVAGVILGSDYGDKDRFSCNSTYMSQYLAAKENWKSIEDLYMWQAVSLLTSSPAYLPAEPDPTLRLISICGLPVRESAVALKSLLRRQPGHDLGNAEFSKLYQIGTIMASLEDHFAMRWRREEKDLTIAYPHARPYLFDGPPPDHSQQWQAYRQARSNAIAAICRDIRKGE